MAQTELAIAPRAAALTRRAPLNERGQVHDVDADPAVSAFPAAWLAAFGFTVATYGALDDVQDCFAPLERARSCSMAAIALRARTIRLRLERLATSTDPGPGAALQRRKLEGG